MSQYLTYVGDYQEEVGYTIYLFKPELIAVEDIHIELNKGNENINSNEGYLNQ